MRNEKRQIRRGKLAVMLLLICLVIGAAIFWSITHDARREVVLDSQVTVDSYGDPFAEAVVPDRVLQNDIVLPVGKLLVTKARAAYEDGTMRLIIPRLELDCVVGADTLMENLEEGPGLYKYSQLPNIYNTNVSIAAHRDLAGCEFYYLDTVTKGDSIYLVYQDMIYQYAYRSTEIVEDTDWSPIHTSYDCRVTLTTCDPIGTSLRRMIVVGELVAYQRYTVGYLFE